MFKNVEKTVDSNYFFGTLVCFGVVYVFMCVEGSLSIAKRWDIAYQHCYSIENRGNEPSF